MEEGNYFLFLGDGFYFKLEGVGVGVGGGVLYCFVIFRITC